MSASPDWISKALLAAGRQAHEDAQNLALLVTGLLLAAGVGLGCALVRWVFRGGLSRTLRR